MGDNLTIATYRNRKIINARHSIEKFFYRDRPTEWTLDELKIRIIEIISKAIDKIIDDFNDTANNPDTDTSYVIHSISTGIGVVVVWRWEWDRYRTDDVNHAIIRAILQMKQDRFNLHPNNVLYSVEHQLRDWAKSKEKKEEEQYDDSFSVRLNEGEYWDCNGTILIVQ
jgi:hypothetical protein